MSQYAKTPIGQAVIAGVNEAVFEIVGQVGARPAEGSTTTPPPDRDVTGLRRPVRTARTRPTMAGDYG